MGNRLRKLRIKGLGGGKGTRKKIDSNVQKKAGKVIKSKQIAKSRLTDALIDRMHNYFGMELRSNAKSELKPELKQALLASMFHVASNQGQAWYSKCYKRNKDHLSRFDER